MQNLSSNVGFQSGRCNQSTAHRLQILVLDRIQPSVDLPKYLFKVSWNWKHNHWRIFRKDVAGVKRPKANQHINQYFHTLQIGAKHIQKIVWICQNLSQGPNFWRSGIRVISCALCTVKARGAVKNQFAKSQFSKKRELVGGNSLAVPCARACEGLGRQEAPGKVQPGLDGPT